ncbi:hypothetical protein ABZ366_25725, partial [Streptomyces sp. NPDC005904]
MASSAPPPRPPPPWRSHEPGAAETSSAAILINQLRGKIGVMFGSPETTTGGRVLKFYASVRMDIRRIETLKDGTDAVRTPIAAGTSVLAA